MRAHQEKALTFKTEALERVGGIYLRCEVREHFEERASRLDDAVGRKSLAQQIFARDRAVDEVDVGGVIHNAPVDLLWNALVVAAVSGFHMEYGNAATF